MLRSCQAPGAGCARLPVIVPRRRGAAIPQGFLLCIVSVGAVDGTRSTIGVERQRRGTASAGVRSRQQVAGRIARRRLFGSEESGGRQDRSSILSTIALDEGPSVLAQSKRAARSRCGRSIMTDIVITRSRSPTDTIRQLVGGLTTSRHGASAGSGGGSVAETMLHILVAAGTAASREGGERTLDRLPRNPTGQTTSDGIRRRRIGSIDRRFHLIVISAISDRRVKRRSGARADGATARRRTPHLEVAIEVQVANALIGAFEGERCIRVLIDARLCALKGGASCCSVRVLGEAG